MKAEPVKGFRRTLLRFRSLLLFALLWLFTGAFSAAGDVAQPEYGVIAMYGVPTPPGCWAPWK